MSKRSTERKRSIPGLNGGLNLTPLLDIIFNLIFFFILATNIQEKNRFLDLSLPESTQGNLGEQLDETPEIVLTGDGVIRFDGEEVNVDQLRETLEQRVRQDQLRRVIFSGDQRISYQQMIDIAEICTAAGVREFQTKMETRPPEPLAEEN